MTSENTKPTDAPFARRIFANRTLNLRSIQAIGYEGWIVLETPGGDDPIAAGKAN